MQQAPDPIPRTGREFGKGFAFALLGHGLGIGLFLSLATFTTWYLPWILLGAFQFVYLLPWARFLAPRRAAFWKGYWMSAVLVALINGSCFLYVMRNL
ncbi:MAG: hypothetical protein R3F17_05185 [Planctomycetota bacterium]